MDFHLAHYGGSVDEGRRKQQRARYSGWVEVEAGARRRVARGRDLSAEGVGVSMSAPHPAEGELIEGEFALPGLALPVAVRARVVWSDPAAGEMGLCFVSLEPALAELLENFVAGWL